DADAGVAHRDVNLAAFDPRADLDPAALWGELDRVGEQVEEDLLDLPLVGAHGADLAVDRLGEGDAAADRARAARGEGVVDGDGQRDGRQLELHAPGLDLRQVEDVVDQREQVAP